MILIFIVTSIVPYHVLGDPSPIVGGDSSEIKDNAGLVSIQRNDYHKCVGSIISKNIVLTAAHCVFDRSPDSLIVRVGSSRTDSGGTWHRVVAKIYHKDFRIQDGAHRFFLCDVALIRVAPAFEFCSNVVKIQLAERGLKVIPGRVASVAGWRSVHHKSAPIMELKSVDLKVIDSAVCARAYGDREGQRIKFSNLICAAWAGRDACGGDSGAPLTADGVQIGIVSSGVGCADTRFPGIYTDISHYRDWIDTNSLIIESLEFPAVNSTHSDPITNRTFGIPSIWGTR